MQPWTCVWLITAAAVCSPSVKGHVPGAETASVAVDTLETDSCASVRSPETHVDQSVMCLSAAGILCYSTEINPCLEGNGGCHANAECVHVGPNKVESVNAALC